jgi:ribosomal protein S18 acetylase RimI-like enzyme
MGDVIRRLEWDDVGFDVASLIYNNGPVVPPYLFGDFEKALPTLVALCRLEKNTFSYRNILGFFKGGKIRGLLVGYNPRKIDVGGEFQDYSSVFSKRDFMLFRMKTTPISILGIRNMCGFYIQNLSVEKSHRGIGIGSALIDSVSKYLRNGGADSIHLHVSLKNKKAQKLYLRSGFSVVKTMRIPLTEVGVQQMTKTA